MPRRALKWLCSIFLLWGAILMLAASHAAAVQLQLGVAGLNLTSSPETDGTTTYMPFIAIGQNSRNHIGLWFEAGYLDYIVNKSGTRTNLALSQGTIDITGTSLALLLVRRFEDIAVRVGGGTIQYQFKNKVSSSVQAGLASVGVTNYQEKLENASGTQYVAGLDYYTSRNVFIGLEYRVISLKPTVSYSATFLGTPLTIASQTADLSHSWTGIRVGYEF